MAKKQSTARQVRRSVEREAAKVKASREQELLEGREVTDVSTWKTGGGRQPVKVLLPSGNVCLAINKGLQALIRGGRIPNNLLPIIQTALDAAENKGKPKKKGVDAADMVLKDPELMASTFDLADMIVLDCVVQPPIAPAPQENEERDPSVLYVDELDLDDKLFILNWVVGGTRDVEQFREELADVVEDIQDGDEDEPEA